MQPVGDVVPGWQPRARPPRSAMFGRLCSVEPLDPRRHGAELYVALAEPRLWTYLAVGPFGSSDELLAAHCSDTDRLVNVICVDGAAMGTASFMRIDPAAGSIEIGAICLAPALQRTAAATEAMYLLLRRAFNELGYRRVEWKCDALNAASRSAAERLGFRFEGTFRQALVYKGRNRDTAWFSIVDHEWPVRQEALERWLSPANFDASGEQRAKLQRTAGH